MQRNFILFILVSAFILAGWFWMVTSMRTPEKKEEPDLAKAKLTQEKKPETTKKETPKKIEPKKEEIKVEPKKEVKKEAAKSVPEEPLKTETLGGAGFHMTVDVMSRGAAVRKVVLNHFKAADWRGRPTDRPFELIQDDELTGSYRMYHYENPKAENPVFGLGEKIWKLEGSGKHAVKDKDGKLLHHEVQFSTKVPGQDKIVIKKTYRLEPFAYHVTLLVAIEDKRDPNTEQAVDFRYQLTGAQGLPVEGEFYTSIFRNAIIAQVDRRGSVYRKLEESMRISAHKGGDAYPDLRGDNRLQYAGVVNQFFAAMLVVDSEQPPRGQGGMEPEKILDWARPTLETNERRGVIFALDLAKNTLVLREGTQEHSYILLPRTARHLEDLELDVGQRAVISHYELPDGREVATWARLGETLQPQFNDITVRSISEPVKLYPGSTKVHQFMLYHGPVKVALLHNFTGSEAVPEELVDKYTHTLALRTLTDYPSDNPFGWVASKVMLTDVIILFTRLMHWLLNLLHYVFGYGLSIIVLTLIVRGLMFPISRRQAMVSMKMQEIAPEMKKIRERYKDDPQAQMQATFELQRKHGVSAFGSCWTAFLQLPIFMGLYFALQESIFFRLAPFLWIENLAAPDMLLYWSESIPIISSPDHSGILSFLYLGPYLNVLPIIAATLMLVVQIQTMPPPADEQAAMQQSMMRYMTIFFAIMFYKVAAGLCIYFITSSLWGLAERKLLPKKKALETGAPPPPGSGSPGTGITAKLPPPAPRGKGKGGRKDKEKQEETMMDRIKAWWKEVLKQAEKK